MIVSISVSTPLNDELMKFYYFYLFYYFNLFYYFYFIIFILFFYFLLQKGQVYERKGEFEEAQVCYENALSVNPYHTSSLRNLVGAWFLFLTVS